MTQTLSWGVRYVLLRLPYLEDQIKGLQGTHFLWIAVVEEEQVFPPLSSRHSGSNVCQH